MPRLFIANLIAPTFLLSERTGGIFIFIGIILLEWIAIWFFFNNFIKTKVGFIKSLVVSLTANIVSALLGLLLPLYVAFNPSNLTTNLITLFLAFIGSILIEWRFHAGFIRIDNTGYPRLKSSIFANLLSYTILIIYVVCISIWLPQTTRFTIPNFEAQSNIDAIFKAQKEFYLENSRFTNTFQQLKELDSKVIQKTNTIAEGHYYRYDIDADEKKVQVKVTPKTPRSRGIKLLNYIAILFAKPKFVYGICESDNPSNLALKSPQIIDGKIQCPPNSRLLEITYSDL